ncbi:ABC-2 type transport system permease protein [Lentzea xinjiangensis]|uniref:ABC-2 type transport system permease protein n=1 Tax=Lentzea xinjiangensis TaxID=402600 RepID=A0A1H9WQ87_9PSEU|nr:ABC-2 family transporter protein [Lentzea xinjiangensis]SES36092.1 ABC-2 type transport system permease protein [Lentzea xinjiangensis]
MRVLRIFLRLQLTQLRAAVQYRGDFWIGIVGAVLTQASALVFLVSYFSQVELLGGWTAWEVLILGGIAVTGHSLTELFADGMWTLRAAVSDGSFDRVLVRPLSPALQQTASLASIHGLGGLGSGLAMLIAGLVNSSAATSWWSVPVIVLAVLCGGVLSVCLGLIGNSIVFWEPAAQSAVPMVVMSMRDLARFPLNVYNAGIRVVLTYVLPYALVTYVPTSAVLHKPGSHGWWALSPVIAAAAGFGFAALVWRTGIRRYEGAGH